MKEVCIFPEMVAAGLEAMQEARVACLPENEIVIEVYLAMSAIWEMFVIRESHATKH